MSNEEKEKLRLAFEAGKDRQYCIEWQMSMVTNSKTCISH